MSSSDEYKKYLYLKKRLMENYKMKYVSFELKMCKNPKINSGKSPDYYFITAKMTYKVYEKVLVKPRCLGMIINEQNVGRISGKI